MVYMCEVGMDWVKHSFVLKFNRIHANMYSKFNAVLCHDYITSRKQLRVRVLSDRFRVYGDVLAFALCVHACSAVCMLAAVSVSSTAL